MTISHDYLAHRERLSRAKHSRSHDNCWDRFRRNPTLFRFFAQGFDSIVARGRQEPDSSKDIQLTIDGKRVTVPQGKPKNIPAYQGSRFSSSEYLVRKTSIFTNVISLYDMG